MASKPGRCRDGPSRWDRRPGPPRRLWTDVRSCRDQVRLSVADRFRPCGVLAESFLRVRHAHTRGCERGGHALSRMHSLVQIDDHSCGADVGHVDRRPYPWWADVALRRPRARALRKPTARTAHVLALGSLVPWRQQCPHMPRSLFLAPATIRLYARNFVKRLPTTYTLALPLRSWVAPTSLEPFHM